MACEDHPEGVGGSKSVVLACPSSGDGPGGRFSPARNKSRRSSANPAASDLSLRNDGDQLFVWHVANLLAVGVEEDDAVGQFLDPLHPGVRCSSASQSVV